MRFLSIVKKEILHNIRDKRAMFLMTLFPILLIVILGLAFANSFGSSNVIKHVKVAYKIDSESVLYDSFVDFTKSIKESIDVQFDEITDDEKARNDVSNGAYDAYIDMTSDEVINLYMNSLRVYNANLVRTVMESFVQKTNLITEVYDYAPDEVGKIMPEGGYKPDYTKLSSVEAKPTPSSKDYYAITMFTMIILYSTNIGAFSIISERLRHTYERVMCSYVSRISYLLAKVTGTFIITCIQVALVYLFSRYMLRTNWGAHPEYTLIIAASLVFMAVSLGIGITEGIKSPGVLVAVLNMTIPVFVFLAGGYIPLSVFNSSILNSISNISPLKWTNQAMFDMILYNDYSKMPMAIGINLIIGLVFLSIPIIIIYRRKDVA